MSQRKPFFSQPTKSGQEMQAVITPNGHIVTRNFLGPKSDPLLENDVGILVRYGILNEEQQPTELQKDAFQEVLEAMKRKAYQGMNIPLQMEGFQPGDVIEITPYHELGNQKKEWWGDGKSWAVFVGWHGGTIVAKQFVGKGKLVNHAYSTAHVSVQQIPDTVGRQGLFDYHIRNDRYAEESITVEGLEEEEVQRLLRMKPPSMFIAETLIEQCSNEDLICELVQGHYLALPEKRNAIKKIACVKRKIDLLWKSVREQSLYECYKTLLWNIKEFEALNSVFCEASGEDEKLSEEQRQQLLERMYALEPKTVVEKLISPTSKWNDQQKKEALEIVSDSDHITEIILSFGELSPEATNRIDEQSYHSLWKQYLILLEVREDVRDENAQKIWKKCILNIADKIYYKHIQALDFPRMCVLLLVYDLSTDSGFNRRLKNQIDICEAIVKEKRTVNAAQQDFQNMINYNAPYAVHAIGHIVDDVWLTNTLSNTSVDSMTRFYILRELLTRKGHRPSLKEVNTDEWINGILKDPTDFREQAKESDDQNKTLAALGFISNRCEMSTATRELLQKEYFLLQENGKKE